MTSDEDADALDTLAVDLARVADSCRDIDRRDIAFRLARASRQLAKIAIEARRVPQFAPNWADPAAANRHF